MKALILAGGYATRMYPLTLDRPKALLPVGRKPIIDYIVENLARVAQVREFVIVTNRLFCEHFLDWMRSRKFFITLKIIEDGTTRNEDRLGALGDMKLALDIVGPGGDWLIVAGDNIFPYELQDAVRFFQEKGTDVVTCYQQPDLARLRLTGVAVLGEGGRVLDFEEKPAEPKSRWAVPPLYVYREATVRELPEYLAEGNPSDAPGQFLAWLCRRKAVHALVCREGPEDIGTLASYVEADRRHGDGGGTWAGTR